MSQDRLAGGRIVPVLVAGVLLALAVGCTNPVRVETDFDPNFDFSRLGTWDWVPDVLVADGPPARQGVPGNTLLRDRVSSAIERSLAERGMRRVSADPDFRVGFAVAHREAVEVRSRPDTSVHHGHAWRGRRGVYTGWGGSSVDIRQFTEGTLVIDVVDAAGERLLWRGTGTTRLREETDPQRRTEVVNNGVTRILADFPPGRAAD